MRGYSGGALLRASKPLRIRCHRTAAAQIQIARKAQARDVGLARAWAFACASLADGCKESQRLAVNEQGGHWAAFRVGGRGEGALGVHGAAKA